MFANLLNAVKRRDRFTLEELRRLNDVVARTTTVTTANRDALVETFREIMELMIWGGPERALVFRRLCRDADVDTLLQVHKSAGGIVRPTGRANLPAEGHTVYNFADPLHHGTEHSIGRQCFTRSATTTSTSSSSATSTLTMRRLWPTIYPCWKTISLKLNPATVQFFFDYGEDVQGGNKAPGGYRMPNSVVSLFTRAVGFGGAPGEYGQGCGEDRRVECVRRHDKELRRYLPGPENWALHVSVSG